MTRDLPPPPPALLHGASLFLDFDGTLVDIAERPDAVSVDARLRMLMMRLATGLEGRLAIISGRALDEIDRLTGIDTLAAAGSHGLEMRTPHGVRSAPARPPGLDGIVAEMRALGERHPGVLVEEKPFGAALHYRRAPEAAEACRVLALRLAEDEGVSLQAGKMVFEIRASGADKGEALAAFMAAPPMAGTRPMFMGDDVTDEAGFAAAARLGGAGILVGQARETAACYRLDDVPAVLGWLQAAAAAL